MAEEKEYTDEDYARLTHALQSGVAAKMQHEGQGGSTSPKHLRTGVNMALCDSGALIELLIDKGVITKQEIRNALCSKLEAEVKGYEKELSEIYGRKVTLA